MYIRLVGVSFWFGQDIDSSECSARCLIITCRDFSKGFVKLKFDEQLLASFWLSSSVCLGTWLSTNTAKDMRKRLGESGLGGGEEDKVYARECRDKMWVNTLLVQSSILWCPFQKKQTKEKIHDKWALKQLNASKNRSDYKIGSCHFNSSRVTTDTFLSFGLSGAKLTSGKALSWVKGKVHHWVLLEETNSISIVYFL